MIHRLMPPPQKKELSLGDFLFYKQQWEDGFKNHPKDIHSRLLRMKMIYFISIAL